MTKEDFSNSIQALDGFLAILENKKIRDINTNLSEWVVTALVEIKEDVAEIVSKQYYLLNDKVYKRE